MDITYDMFIETEVPEEELIVSRTDLNGVITYVNDTFARISGYDASELVGKPHNILRHNDMPKSVFRQMWQQLASERKWSGYVKNRRKDGGFYWVFAEISGVYKEGELVEYKSLRSHVPPKKRLEMQYEIDSIRYKENENVRAVSYLPKASYDELQSRAQKENISVEVLIQNLLSL